MSPAVNPPATGGAGRRAPIRILRLTLAGFGVYERPTSFYFPPERAVLVRPNECGKSTLFHGLAATLFGLPGSSDPSKFGAARFRSFSHPKEFWGEIEWEADGRRYQLHRVFETHRVSLKETGSKDPMEPFQGEHNPRGTSSAGSAFPEQLRALLGLGSLELFLQAFCLTQPMPEERGIGSDLQHLLSGSRAGRVDDVLDALFDQTKTLTRATGDLGLLRPGKTRLRNQQDPGVIEQLEENLARMRADLAEGGSLLEQLNARNHELEETQADIRRLQASVERRNARLRGVRQWLDWNDERRRRSEAIQQARSALAQLAEIDGERLRIAPDLADRFAPFQQAPGELPTILEAVENAQAELRGAEQAAKAGLEERTSLEAEAASLEGRLASEFRDVRGRTGLLILRDQLAAAMAQREARRRELEGGRDTVASLGKEMADQAAWEGLAPEVLRPQAEAILQDMRRLDGIESRLAEIARQSEEREFLSGARLASLQEKIAAEERLRVLVLEIRRMEAEQARIPAPSGRGAFSPIRTWLALASSLVVGAALHWGTDLDLPRSAGAALAVLAFLLLLDRILRARAGRASRPTAETEPGIEGPPVAATLEDARGERTRLEERVRQLEGDLGPYARTTMSELARLEERWSRFDEEAARLDQERDTLLRQRFEAAPRDEGSRGRGEWKALAASSVPLMADLARLPGAPGNGTVGQTAEWLASLDGPAWSRFLQASSTRMEVEQKLRAAREKVGRLEKEDLEDDAPSVLGAQIAPFTLDTPEETLKSLLAECGELEGKLGVARERLARVPDPDKLAASTRQAEERVEQVRQNLRRLWPAAERLEQAADRPPGEDLDAWARRMREEERAARQAWQKNDELEASLRRVLSTARAGSREELERRETEENAALGALIRQIDEMERGDVLLASWRDTTDQAARASGLQEQELRERSELAEEEKALEEARSLDQKLLRQLATLEGSTPPNVAQLEIRIRELEVQREEMLRHRDALALAFGWVREAADLFQSAYREDLESGIGARFRILTGVADRRIRIDESFALSVIGPGDEPMALEQLSQGARDQLALAIRLAVADLLAGSVPLPLFFDDPFVHYDAERLEHLHETLDRLSRERQWVLLTHREDLAAWGDPIRVEVSG